MTGNVITLRPRADPDAAWARYQSLAARLIDDPRLALDRSFMEQLHLADLAFKATLDRTARAS